MDDDVSAEGQAGAIGKGAEDPELVRRRSGERRSVRQGEAHRRVAGVESDGPRHGSVRPAQLDEVLRPPSVESRAQRLGEDRFENRRQPDARGAVGGRQGDDPRPFAVEEKVSRVDDRSRSGKREGHLRSRERAGRRDRSQDEAAEPDVLHLEAAVDPRNGRGDGDPEAADVLLLEHDARVAGRLGACSEKQSPTDEAAGLDDDGHVARLAVDGEGSDARGPARSRRLLRCDEAPRRSAPHVRERGVSRGVGADRRTAGEPVRVGLSAGEDDDSARGKEEAVVFGVGLDDPHVQRSERGIADVRDDGLAGHGTPAQKASVEGLDPLRGLEEQRFRRVDLDEVVLRREDRLPRRSRVEPDFGREATGGQGVAGRSQHRAEHAARRRGREVQRQGRALAGRANRSRGPRGPTAERGRGRGSFPRELRRHGIARPLPSRPEARGWRARPRRARRRRPPPRRESSSRRTSGGRPSRCRSRAASRRAPSLRPLKARTPGTNRPAGSAGPQLGSGTRSRLRREGPRRGSGLRRRSSPRRESPSTVRRRPGR